MPEDYPKEVILTDGRPVILRPLERTDLDRLRDFFSRIPEEDRWFLDHDLRDPRVAARFIEELDLSRVFPVVALDQGRMVAEATLHRREYGSRSHIGRIRVLVDPDYRHKRLGTWLILDLINLALEFGLEQLEARFVVGLEDRPREALRQFDFFEAARLKNYVKDQKGQAHDLAVLIKTLCRTWIDF